MKISEVSRVFAEHIARHTGYFSEPIANITNATAAANIVTVTTSTAHTLKTGDRVTISNWIRENPITGVAVNGQNVRFTTQYSHDLTLDYSKVTLAGFTDSLWNGDAKLVGVPKRTNFVTESKSTLPILNGNEKLKEYLEVGNYAPNLVAVTVSTPTSFTFNAGIDLTGRTIAINSVSKKVRVSAAINLEAATEAYTRQNDGKLWAFIVHEDVTISKDRKTISDAVSERGASASMIETIMDGFTLYVFAPCSEQYAAVQAVDICRHDLLLPILKTLRGFKFNTGTSAETKNGTILTDHGIADYNGAFLIYRYSFQVVSQLSNGDQNTFPKGGSVAFRDVEMTVDYPTGTSQGVNNLNLDEEI